VYGAIAEVIKKYGKRSVCRSEKYVEKITEPFSAGAGEKDKAPRKEFLVLAELFRFNAHAL
jgi:hypothetical protein